LSRSGEFFGGNRCARHHDKNRPGRRLIRGGFDRIHVDPLQTARECCFSRGGEQRRDFAYRPFRTLQYHRAHRGQAQAGWLA
jgi:hypothetical protein